MLKIKSPIIYITLFILFYLNPTQAQTKRDIILPKIPVYVVHSSSTSISLDTDVFEQVNGEIDSWYTIETDIENVSSVQPIYVKRLLTIASSFVAYKIGSGIQVTVEADGSELEGIEDKLAAIMGLGTAYVLGGTVAAGLFSAGLRGYVTGDDERIMMINVSVLIRIKNTATGNVHIHTYNKIMGTEIFDPIMSGIGFFGTVLYGAGPLLGWVPFLLSTQEDLLPDSMIVKGVEFTDMIAINDPQIEAYFRLNRLVSDGYRGLTDVNYYTLDNKKRIELSDLGRPKGEFESTRQYSERIKEEELVRRAIEAEYQQELAQLKEENEIKRMQSLRDIENSAAKIRFEQPFDFQLSDYDADKQTFTFTINKSGSDQSVFHITKDVDNIRSGPSSRDNVIAKCYRGDEYKLIDEGDLGWHKIVYESKVAYIHRSNGYVKAAQRSSSVTKELVVPIADAPQFKTKSGNLVVKQMVKPSLDGRWVPVYDDVVLADASTGKIIPWEGEVPTYATAPVTNPPSLSAAVDLSEPSGEGYLDAEEIGTLKITLKNDGSGPAKTTRISLSQTSGPTIYYDVTSTVDEIKAGESHTTRFRLTVPESVTDGKVEYSISFLEAQGFEPQPLSFTAETRAQRPPELTLVDFGVVDQSGDGKVTKGESAEITARIQNRGQGKAKGVKVNVIENPVKNIFLAPYSEKEFSLGEIEAGDVRDVVFTVLTNNRVEDVVSVELKMDEKRPRFANNAFVELEIDKQQAQLAPLAFRGKDTAVDIADLATLTVDIEKDIPTSGKKRDNALAVVFGVEDYKNVSSVTFAKRDATYAKEYFEKVLGIPSSRIYFRTDSDVSGTEFSKVFSKEGWLDKRLKKGETEIYIYYAGHGAPELKANKAYLIPYDGDPNYASQTGYALDQLYSELGALGAKSTTVFLDACFSGANRESEVLLAGARPVFMEVDELKVSGNLTVFSAASGRQISSAWPEKKHGLFSYFLMKGMRGDADVNGDREITMGELGDYIKENVSDMAGMLDREQTPGLQTVDRGKVLVKY